MKYPCINKQVSFLVDNELPDEVILLNRITGDICSVSTFLADILLELDGMKNPFDFVEDQKEELKVALKKLKKDNMLKKRFYRNGVKLLFPLYFQKINWIV